MSCVTSREVAGPVGPVGGPGGPGGGPDGRLLRLCPARRHREQGVDVVLDLVDAVAVDAARSLSKLSLLDCNSNVADMEWGYADTNGEFADTVCQCQYAAGLAGLALRCMGEAEAPRTLVT